jgi:hypothetical protein
MAALSEQDILRYVPGVNIIRYKDLDKIRNIEDIIPKAGLVILYPGRTSNSGHWICLFINKKKLWVFDSYGNKIDEALEYDQGTLDPRMYNRLSYLLAKSPLPIDFNNYQFQSAGKQVTCGYWCVARLRNKNLTTDQFFELWGLNDTDQYLPDELVEYYVKNY